MFIGWRCSRRETGTDSFFLGGRAIPWWAAGLAGLVVAGVFAAAMSSLDSSMHSIATSVVTDWLKPNGAARSEAEWLRIARHLTLAAGLFGTLTAALLAGTVHW